jgi:hypothetical protein
LGLAAKRGKLKRLKNRLRRSEVEAIVFFVSTRQLIDQEIASMPEELQQKVYDFAMRLKRNARDEAFNGAELSESVLALDWNSPQEDAAWSNL